MHTHQCLKAKKELDSERVRLMLAMASLSSNFDKDIRQIVMRTSRFLTTDVGLFCIDPNFEGTYKGQTC